MLKLGRLFFLVGLSFTLLGVCFFLVFFSLGVIGKDRDALVEVLVISSPCLLSGICLVTIGLGLAFVLTFLKGDDVIESWSILILGGQGKAEEIFWNTEAFLAETQAPALRAERQLISPRAIRAVVGERREFLVITDARKFRFKPYKIFFNASDYGGNLNVAWYLTFYPGFWRLVMEVIPFVSLAAFKFSELDLFDQQDMTAYVTNAHHCVLAAVDKLLLELNQDPSKIDRKTRGFLGIS